MIKAAIFDMDGLLIDSEPFWKYAERFLYESVGVFIDDDFLRQVEGLRLDEAVQFVYDRHPFTKKSKKQVEVEIIAMMQKLILEKGEALPGVYQTLELFYDRKIPMALASSSAEVLISAVIEKLSLQKYFIVTRSGERETFGKPHPQIFISTAQALNVYPGECVVFEDSLNGILAAKAARMFCVAVPDKHRHNDPRLAIADAKLKSLEEFGLALLPNLSSH
ncbi:MAG: hexitol phosphatase HxpB [Bacteroidetes bacterium]|nr:hexitol phosphatase HxpB [Bacteroidota bacterium]